MTMGRFCFARCCCLISSLFLRFVPFCSGVGTLRRRRGAIVDLSIGQAGLLFEPFFFTIFLTRSSISFLSWDSFLYYYFAFLFAAHIFSPRSTPPFLTLLWPPPYPGTSTSNTTLFFSIIFYRVLLLVTLVSLSLSLSLSWIPSPPFIVCPDEDAVPVEWGARHRTLPGF